MSEAVTEKMKEATANLPASSSPEAGPEAAPPDNEVSVAWPDDWRERMAAATAGEDRKALAKEMKRLQRYADPAAIWNKAAELEARLSGGGLVKIPAEDASEAERSAFHRALGVPAKAAGYFDHVELPDGAVLGEADRPMATGFFEAVHAAGATPAVANAALGWYFKTQEEQASALDESDEVFRVESEQALRGEWGASLERQINSIATLFADAPGGADPDNPNSLMTRLLAGRTADGKYIGNDPDVTRLLVSLARQLSPSATVTTAATGGAHDRLGEIRRFRQEHPGRYDADKQMQAEELELIEGNLKAREGLR